METGVGSGGGSYLELLFAVYGDVRKDLLESISDHTAIYSPHYNIGHL